MSKDAGSSPAAEQRGWSVKMIAWSAALAAVLLLTAWGAANWKVFHLAYCKHLLRSMDLEDQGQALKLIEHTHLAAGMSKVQVEQIVSPHPVVSLPSPRAYYDEGYTHAVILPGYPHYGLQLDFDADGMLVKWRTTWWEW